MGEGLGLEELVAILVHSGVNPKEMTVNMASAYIDNHTTAVEFNLGSRVLAAEEHDGS